VGWRKVNMKIVTFYSYKGGTGRSLTLANVACALNLSFKQIVGMVDLDCEAAALHELFQVNPGSANLLALLQPRNRSVTNLEQHVVSVPLGSGALRQLHLLPSVTDSRLIDEIHWDAGVESFLQEEAFPAFGRVFALDYLLLDARSGVSSFANFSLRICDLAVIVGRGDRQHASGLKRIFEVCKAAGKPFHFVLNGCPAPERNRGRIEQFAQKVGSPPDVVVPYPLDLFSRNGELEWGLYQFCPVEQKREAVLVLNNTGRMDHGLVLQALRMIENLFGPERIHYLAKEDLVASKIELLDRHRHDYSIVGQVAQHPGLLSQAHLGSPNGSTSP